MIWGYPHFRKPHILFFMGMDQYLLIPFLGGWTSINPSYFDVNYRGTIGFDTLPYSFFGDTNWPPKRSEKTTRIPRMVWFRWWNHPGNGLGQVYWCVLRREWMGCWGLLGWLLIPSGYVKIAIENHHLLWIFPLKMVIFHSYVKLPEGSYCGSFPKIPYV